MKHFKENQKQLLEYLEILKNSQNVLAETYFIIVYNFLFLENKYFDSVKESKKEINRYLDLPKLETVEDVLDKFAELYGVYNNVRFAVETFDSVEEIRLRLKKSPDFYTKLQTV